MEDAALAGPDGVAGKDPIDDCLAGAISAEVAAARLLLWRWEVERIEAEVRARRPAPVTPEWEALSRLVAERRDALLTLSAEIANTGGDPQAGQMEGLAGIAAFFDRAVEHSPEAAVALHSLGDARTLAVTTAEIVDWLAAEGLIGPGRDVLDLGCGIGRLATALSPRCRSVLGVDISAGMVAEARRRCAGLGNVRLERTEGDGLPSLAPGSVDLVLAVDSMPYMVQAGVADGVIARAAAMLTPTGAIAVLNLSYRGDPAADRADLHRWAAAHGLAATSCGERPFRQWDGQAFVLRKAP